MVSNLLFLELVCIGCAKVNSHRENSASQLERVDWLPEAIRMCRTVCCGLSEIVYRVAADKVAETRSREPNRHLHLPFTNHPAVRIALDRSVFLWKWLPMEGLECGSSALLGFARGTR